MLPMAVQQDILIACCRNESSALNILNTDGEKFPCEANMCIDQCICELLIFLFSREFHTGVNDYTIEKGGPWHNYFLCGFKVQ